MSGTAFRVSAQPGQNSMSDLKERERQREREGEKEITIERDRERDINRERQEKASLVYKLPKIAKVRPASALFQRTEMFPALR